MKANNSTQPDKAPSTAESGKEVAKQNGFATSAGSKFSPQYWASRVFRPVYVRGEDRGTVQEWWARIQSAGRREAVGMGTNDKQAAARRAALLYAKVKAAGWQAALAEFAPDQAEQRTAARSQTFGEAIASAIADKGADVKPATLHGYASSARQLVAMAAGKEGGREKYDYRTGGRDKWIAKLDALPQSRITGETMQAALDAKIAAVRADGMKERSARRTCAAAIREAKSLFSGREWNPFAKLAVRTSAPPQYSGRLDVGGLIRAGMEELREASPEQLAALLLFAGCGLRKSEADAARWNWIDPERGTLAVRADATFSPKTHASEAPVFVDPGFVGALLSLRPEDATEDAYILAPELPALPPTTFARYRAAHVFDKLTAWLKTHGLATRTPLHDLRREFGSFIAQTADIFTASRQLRHSSIQVTASHYAAQRRHVAPVFAAMLAQPSTPAAK